jgi:hypothetical protein
VESDNTPRDLSSARAKLEELAKRPPVAVHSGLVPNLKSLVVAGNLIGDRVVSVAKDSKDTLTEAHDDEVGEGA